MKSLLLASFLIFSVTLIAQKTNKVNELGLIFIPNEYYHPTDTVVEKIDSIFKSLLLVSNTPFAYKKDSSFIDYVPYYNEVYYAYEITSPTGFKGTLSIDTNGVNYQKITSSKVGFINSDTLVLPRNIEIEFQLSNSDPNDSVNIQIQSYRTEINIIYSSDLPILNPIYIDIRDSIVYNSMPIGFVGIDTTIIKDYSKLFKIRTPDGFTDMGTRDEFILESSFDNYFYAIHLYTAHPQANSNNTILINDTIFKNIDGTGNRLSNPVFTDTLVLDSSTKITIIGGKGKNYSFYSVSEVFHTTTNIYIEKVVGLEKFKAKTTPLKLYPNPVNDNLIIDVSNDYIDMEYKIYDTTFKLVKEGILQEKQISISNLPNGLYFLRLPQKGVQQKFIKQ